jgi:hypothetical protein
MTKEAPKGTSDGRKPNDPAEAAGEGASGADFAMHEHIGRQLKLMFDEVAGEAIPDKLRQLLEELKRKEKKS